MRRHPARVAFAASIVLTLLVTVLPATLAIAVATPAQPTVTSAPGPAPALQISWPDVSGAAGYRIQYAKTSAFQDAQLFPAGGRTPLLDNEATVPGLTADVTYYFRVAVVNATNSERLSAYSPTARGTPHYAFAAPGDLVPAAVTRSTLRLTWPAVPAAPGYRVELANSAGRRTYATPTNALSVTGLNPRTAYRISAVVEQPTGGSAAGTVLSAESPRRVVSTTAYALASPDGLRAGQQSPTSVGLSWTAPGTGLASGQAYFVEYADDAAIKVGRRTAGPFPTPTATLARLDDNHTYFARVFVGDARGRPVSGSSEYVLAKTIVARGALAGRATGVTGSDLVATAYTTGGDAAQEVPVSADGSYTLDVRPGRYRVQVSYLGTGSYTSPWSRTGSDGGRIPAEASTWTVRAGQTTTAAAVEVAAGGVVKGIVRTSAGNPVRDVHVTALTAMTSDREVAAAVTSGNDGRYTVRGLANGRYWLRYVYSGDGFATRSISVTVSKGVITQARVSTAKVGKGASVSNPITRVNARLDNAPFRASRRASASGPKVVGSVLTAKATPWLAGAHPTTRATMSLRWMRNGVPIPYATGGTYRLTARDQGQRISVTATARRYGYQTASVTSKSYAIS